METPTRYAPWPQKEVWTRKWMSLGSIRIHFYDYKKCYLFIVHNSKGRKSYKKERLPKISPLRNRLVNILKNILPNCVSSPLLSSLCIKLYIDVLVLICNILSYVSISSVYFHPMLPWLRKIPLYRCPVTTPCWTFRSYLFLISKHVNCRKYKEKKIKITRYPTSQW